MEDCGFLGKTCHACVTGYPFGCRQTDVDEDMGGASGLKISIVGGERGSWVGGILVKRNEMYVCW